MASKQETIRCGRCGCGVECKANAYSKCQCNSVYLNLNEVQYVSECFDGCLCTECLTIMQTEYRVMVGINM